MYRIATEGRCRLALLCSLLLGALVAFGADGADDRSAPATQRDIDRLITLVVGIREDFRTTQDRMQVDLQGIRAELRTMRTDINERFDKVYERFDKVYEQFDRVNGRLDGKADSGDIAWWGSILAGITAVIAILAATTTVTLGYVANRILRTETGRRPKGPRGSAAAPEREPPDALAEAEP